MRQAETDLPLTELLAGLGTTIPRLLHKEIELAKAEAAAAADTMLGAMLRFVVGTVFAIGAAGVLLAAAVSGVRALLVWQGLDPLIAASLAAVVVAAMAGGVAWLLFLSASTALRAARDSLERSASSLAADATTIVERRQ